MDAVTWSELVGDGPIDRVGAIGSAIAATDEHVADLDTKFRVLNEDIKGQLTPKTAPEFADWEATFLEWEKWFTENGVTPAVLIPGVNFNLHKNDEFAAWVNRYNAALDHWSQSIHTSANPFNTRPPAADYLKWGLYAAGGLGALYLAGMVLPLVLPALLKK